MTRDWQRIVRIMDRAFTFAEKGLDQLRKNTVQHVTELLAEDDPMTRDPNRRASLTRGGRGEISD